MKIFPAPFRGLLFSRLEQLTSGEDKGIGPPGADKFYLALGVAMVVWGRLEGNFLACLLVVLQIAKDRHETPNEMGATSPHME